MYDAVELKRDAHCSLLRSPQDRDREDCPGAVRQTRTSRPPTRSALDVNFQDEDACARGGADLAFVGTSLAWTRYGSTPGPRPANQLSSLRSKQARSSVHSYARDFQERRYRDAQVLPSARNLRVRPRNPAQCCHHARLALGQGRREGPQQAAAGPAGVVALAAPERCLPRAEGALEGSPLAFEGRGRGERLGDVLRRRSLVSCGSSWSRVNHRK